MTASRLSFLVSSTWRPGFWLAVNATLALGLGACASDEAGRRALVETTTLRTQLDELKQREENNAREIARIQSQVRGLESDAVDKTREVRTAGVELARARVLLEEARAELRERAATPPPAPVAMPATPAAATVAAPVAPAPAPAPVTPPSPPPSPAVVPPHTVPVIPPRAAVTTPAAARSAQSAEQLFSAAMANFRAQEPGQAVLELTDLIARFPDHALAPSAQLRIGEAYYQQRDYRQSLVELRRVVDGYPKSLQVADALLKTGLCHRALGDRAAARTAWEQVVREHSSTAAAGQARSRLGTRESAARSGR